MSAQQYHLNRAGDRFVPCQANTRACPLGQHMDAGTLQGLGYAARLTRADQWQVNADAYAAFIKSAGHLPKQKGETAMEVQLANWGKSQIQVVTDGRDRLPFTTAQLAQLQAVGLLDADGVAVDRRAQRWLAGLDAYRQFRKRYGRDPEPKSVDVEEHQLARWLANNRQAAGGTGTNVWSDEREAALNTINPAWNRVLRTKAKSGERVPWAERYEQLCTWYAEHGYLPNNYTEDPAGRVLGTWLNLQRQIARGNSKIKAPADQVRQLNNIDPAWQARGKTGHTSMNPWLRSLGAVEKFVAEHGRQPQPGSTEAQERKLYGWLRRQRGQALTSQQIMQLDSALPGWNVGRRRGPKPTSSLRSVEGVRRWTELLPDTPLEQAPAELRSWISQQRARLKAGTLNTEVHIQLDELLPGWDLPARRGRSAS